MLMTYVIGYGLAIIVDITAVIFVVKGKKEAN